MNLKNFKRTLRKIYNSVYEVIGNYLVKKNYITDIKRININEKIVDINFLKCMEYMDEADPQIRNMFALHDLKGSDASKYKIQNDTSIEIDTHQLNNENWLAFIVKRMPKKYSIEFDYKPMQSFCEFQVAFNYESLLNRNRFIVMENKQILFDDISQGRFFKPLKGKYSEQIFENGKFNHVRVVCSPNYYEFIVNDKTIMTVGAKYKFHRGRGCAIVLWENYNNRKIQVSISNIVIREITS